MTVARAQYPTAPLEYQADDGKAVALLLAGLAHQDHTRGLDRGAQIQANQAKLKAAKKRARAARKALKTLAFESDPFGIAHQAPPDEVI